MPGHILRTTLGNAGGAIGQLVTLLILVPYLARNLGPSGFALVSVLIALGSLLSVFECGVGSATARLAAAALSDGTPGEFDTTLQVAVRRAWLRAGLAALAGLLLVMVLFYVLPVAPGPALGRPLAALVATALGGMFAVLAAPYVGTLIGLARALDVSAIVAMAAAVRLLLGVWVVERQGGVAAVMAALAVSSGVLVLLARRQVGRLGIGAGSGAAVASGFDALAQARLREALPVNASHLLLAHGDLLLVFWLLGPVPTLLYALGQVLALCTRMAAGVFDSSVIAFIRRGTAAPGSSDPEATPVRLRELRIGLLLGGLLLAPLLVGAGVFCSSWLPWLSQQDRAVVAGVAACLAAGMLLSMQRGRATALLREQRQGGTILGLALGEALLAMLGSGLLVRFGPLGIAAAFGAARLVIGMLLLPLLASRAAGATLSETVWHVHCRGLLPLLVATPLMSAGVTWIPGDPRLVTLGSILLGVGIYLAVALKSVDRRTAA